MALSTTARPRTLWRNADFVKLWFGQTISQFGSGITFLALPLTAITVLEATPAQMGVLESFRALPALLFSLFAGVWVDRLRRRPILIAADAGRALLLLGIPAAAIMGALQMTHLYIIGFLVGTLAMLFGVAYRAYLPSLAPREQLIDGNSKLELSRSAAEIISPGLAGALVQLLTAPIALAVDALSFLASALSIGLIRTHEPPPQYRLERTSLWQDLGEGLQLIRTNRILRALAGCMGSIGLFNSMLETVWLLYLTRHLALDPAQIGLIFSVGGLGFFVGAWLPSRVSRWVGFGPAILCGIGLTSVGDLLTPLATETQPFLVPQLIGGQILFGVGVTIFGVGQVSLRQAITPDHLQGRMNATMSFIQGGVVPVGALLGGLLGVTIGLRATLFLAVIGEASSMLWLVRSPVWSLQALDTTQEIGGDAARNQPTQRA